MSSSRSLFKGAAIALTDRALISVANFMVGLILAKSLPPDDYGLYTLLYAAIVTLTGFQNALITGPMRVLSVRPQGEEIAHYFNVQYGLQIILGCLLSGLAFIVAYQFHSLGLLRSVVIAAVILLSQLQEYSRVRLLMPGTLVELLVVDLKSFGVRIGLLLSGFLTRALTFDLALIIMAVTAAINITSRTLKREPPSFSKIYISQIALHNWQFGRWLLLETIFYFASVQLFIFCTALWLDSESVAGFGAAQNILNIFNILFSGVQAYFMPVARQLYVDVKYVEWRRLLVLTWACISTIILSVGAVLYAYSEELLGFLYTPYYRKFYEIVHILVIVYFVRAGNSIFSLAFKTANLPEVGVYSRALSMVVALFSVYPLIERYGASGAAIGQLLTEILWSLAYLYPIARGKLRQSQIANCGLKV